MTGIVTATAMFDDAPARYPRPPTLPVAGNTLDIAQGGHEILLEWALEYGANPAGVHEVKMLGQTILHVVDPLIARELMVAKSDEFPDRGVSAMAKFFREDQAAFVNTSHAHMLDTSADMSIYPVVMLVTHATIRGAPPNVWPRLVGFD